MKTKYFLVALTVLLTLSGCASTEKLGDKGEAPAPLQPQAALKLGDLPIPVGFKNIPEDSYSFESSGIRVGLLKYQGNAEVEQVISFYKEQMPMYNWNLLNVVEYGQHIINFDRQSETCIINLIPKGKTITMTIFLGPKSLPTGKGTCKPPVK